MIKAFGFSDVTVSKLATKIEDYCARHKIIKNQIISIKYSCDTTGVTALLIYEEGENNDI